VGGSSGAQVTYRGLEYGFATVSVAAGAGEYASAQSVEVLRSTGDLQLSFDGLGDNADPDIHLTGPGGFEQDIDRAELVRDLEPGEYMWTVNPVTGEAIGHEYAGASETGSVMVQRAQTASATIEYERTTAEVAFDAVNVPDPSPAAAEGEGEAVIVLDNAAAAAYTDETQGGGYGIYAKLVSATRTYIIRSPRATIAVIPDTYEWLLFAQKKGYGWEPTVTAGTLVAAVVSNSLIAVPWVATRGIIQASLEGVPPGIAVAALLTLGSTSFSPFLPFTLSRLPGNYLLEILTLTYLNTTLNRTETYEPVQRTHSLSVTIGQTLLLTIVMFLALWIATFQSTISVLNDPFGHAIFIAFLLLILLTVRVNRVPDPAIANGASVDVSTSAVTESITISGPAPWVTVTGPLQADGTFIAAGSGTVAGFPNVPVTFTGSLNADGSISGTLQMGSDTPPTGLPNGAITYTIEGMPVELEEGAPGG
jgi:hypothetical protein